MKTEKGNQKALINSVHSVKIRITAVFLFVLATLIYCSNISAQKPGKDITISGTKFTYSLIEKWIDEYSKTNEDIIFRLITDPTTNEEIDLRVIAHTPEKSELNESENLVKVGRYALLPITNEKNKQLSKKFKNGIKKDGLKEIFLKNVDDWDTESDSKTSTLITVYTKTPQSCSAIVFANYLGRPSTDLNGRMVAGDDKYLISSILRDSTGITYNNLGFIYDLNSRLPLSGIKILPIDLNDNGRLEKEEQIYNNLDQLITLLENINNKTIPTDYVGFIHNTVGERSEVADFVNWVVTSGQQYNHLYGFLSETDPKRETLSLK